MKAHTPIFQPQKTIKYWPAILKWGFGAFTLFIAACFIYGLFNRFSFWHGAAPPGIESGLAYAMLLGIGFGLPVILSGAILGAVIVWRRKRRKNHQI